MSTCVATSFLYYQMLYFVKFHQSGKVHIKYIMIFALNHKIFFFRKKEIAKSVEKEVSMDLSVDSVEIILWKISIKFEISHCDIFD